MLKSSFNFLGAIMKWQRYSESEAMHEIGEVLHCAKDRMAPSKTDCCSNKCILKPFKFLANNVDIHLIWTHCISIIIFNVHM